MRYELQEAQEKKVYFNKFVVVASLSVEVLSNHQLCLVSGNASHFPSDETDVVVRFPQPMMVDSRSSNRSGYRTSAQISDYHRLTSGDSHLQRTADYVLGRNSRHQSFPRESTLQYSKIYGVADKQRRRFHPSMATPLPPVGVWLLSQCCFSGFAETF